MSRDQIRLCLKNIAFLHAQFWKDQKTIGESKPAKSEDIRENHEKIKKTILEYFDKLMASKWKAHGILRPPRDHVVAPWLTVEVSGDFSQPCFGYTMHHKWLHSADDDRYTVLDDPVVQEMFHVMSERYPRFHQQKIQEWVKRDPETIVHGDFHAGNNMFGINKNEGDAVNYKYLILK